MRINIITCQLLFYILKIEEWSDLIGCCINEADTGTFQYSLSSSTNLVLSCIYGLWNQKFATSLKSLYILNKKVEEVDSIIKAIVIVHFN